MESEFVLAIILVVGGIMLEISFWMYIGETLEILTSGDVIIMVMLFEDIAVLFVGCLDFVEEVCADDDDHDEVELFLRFRLDIKENSISDSGSPSKKGVGLSHDTD